MRERAAEADLVIVNHHLLVRRRGGRQGDFGEVIPECDMLVIDEAHQLEDVATQYFGVALSTHRVEEFVRDAARAVACGATPTRSIATALAASVADVQLARHHFFDVPAAGKRAAAATARA